MKVTKRSLFYALCVLFCFANTAMAAPAAAQPTEAEILKMQQEIDAEITKFVNSLPPEEQAQFHKDVEELTKVMENMSEDELMQFLNQVLPPDQPAPLPALEPARPVVTPVKPVEKPKPTKPATPTKPKKQIDEAIAMIDAVIAHTESFIRKSAIIPELPGKIDRWIDKDKLQEVPEETTWAELKQQIEVLNQRLHSLKDTDPKTNNYRYIDHLISNEPLYNNIAMMRTILDTQEQKIEAPAFGLGTMEKSSRKAMRKVIDLYAEALYVLDIPQQILKILALYDPRAKELQEEVEAEQKRAFEESKKTRTAAPKTEGGYGYEPSVSYGKSRYDGGYDGYSQPYYPTYSPQYGEPSYDSDDDEKPRRTPTKDGQKDGAPKKPATPPAAGKPEDKKRDESVDRVLNDTLSYLDEIDDIVNDNPHFKDLSTYLTKGDTIDKAGQDLAANELPKLQRKIKEAADKMRAFNRRIKGLPKSQQSGYKKELKSKTKESLKVINKLERELTNAVNQEQIMPANKRYAYMNGPAKNEAVKKIVPQPVDIKNIVEAIAQLRKQLGSDEDKQ